MPAIDLRNGRCVRLFQGDFDRETDYGDDPARVARGYRQMGFADLHVVDLDGAREGAQRNRESVRAIVETEGLAVQLGGGLRDRDTLEHWLASGVARCVIGSLAATDPERVGGWLEAIGAERIVLAFDVRTKDPEAPILAIEGWTRSANLDLWQCIDLYVGCGLKHVLCTDVGRDGTLRGPNLELYRAFRKRYPELALQASGGVRNTDDLATLKRIGCAAAITGRALLDGRINAEEVGACLRGA